MYVNKNESDWFREIPRQNHAHLVRRANERKPVYKTSTKEEEANV